MTFLILQITYEINRCVTDTSKDFPHEQVAQNLRKLSNMDLVQVDRKWISDIRAQIDELIKSVKGDTNIQASLNDNVKRWKLENFGV